ncbi:MAG: LamG domain-containing protein, partial [Bacteroidota bacterium]
MKRILLAVLFFLPVFLVSLTSHAQLIAQYDFSGNANDGSGNGKNGTVSGATLTDDRFGNANSAYSFTTPGAVISSAQTFGNDLPFSFSVWVKWNGTGGGFQAILNWWIIGGRVYLDVGPTGELRFGDDFTATGIFLSANTWVHIAGTDDANTSVKLYINGVISSQASINTNYQPGSLRIGGDTGSSFGSFNGIIDDVRIYNSVLSPSEIFTLFSEDNGGLVAYYPFNGNANDASGNGFNGVITGASLTTDRFLNANSAMFFNGTSDYIELPFFERPANMTITAWVNFNSNVDNKMIVGWAGNGNSAEFRISGDVLAYNEWDNATFPGVTSSPIPLNEWHFVAITRTASLDSFGNNVYISVDNGVSIGGAVQNNFTTTTQVMIGAYGSFSPPRYFSGSIDEVRIYNSALSASEITDIFQTLSLSPEPTAQPTNLVITAGPTDTSFEYSITPASGVTGGYLHIYKAGSAPTAIPSDGVEYVEGDVLTDGSIVKYSDNIPTGNSYSGLTAGTSYFIQVFAYNGSGSQRNYLTTSPLSATITTTGGSFATEPTSQPTNLLISNPTSTS